MLGVGFKRQRPHKHLCVICGLKVKGLPLNSEVVGLVPASAHTPCAEGYEWSVIVGRWPLRVGAGEWQEGRVQQWVRCGRRR